MITSITAPNPGPYTLDGTKTYLIGTSVVIDPGPEIPSHIEAILAAAPELSTIVVTHRHADHAPAAAALRNRLNVRLFAPAGSIAGAPIDRELADGDRIETPLGPLEAIATPGHTAEHFCFLSPQGDLFTGDTILGEGTTTIFPPDGDMGRYLESLRQLRERRPKRIYPGHGPIRDDAVELIDFYIHHRLEREAQILGILSEGESNLAAMRASVYPDLNPLLVVAAETQLSAHLIHLMEQGKVMQRGTTFLITT